MTYSIHDAHRDGRHASKHPDDRSFWIGQGCTGCEADAEHTWVFEEADPDVGIFGESIVHACAANEDFAEATSDVSIRPDESDARMVKVTTTFTCPADGATTTVVEQNPAEWFEDVR